MLNRVSYFHANFAELKEKNVTGSLSLFLSLFPLSVHFSSVQLSCVWLLVTPWIAACQASLSITNSQSLLKLMSIKTVMPYNLLILCHPLLLPPSIFPSIRVFSNESVLHIRWLKDWSFSFSISPSNKYSGLISFRIDWLDLLTVQGTLKSLLQHHSSKASILQHSAFSSVQFSRSVVSNSLWPHELQHARPPCPSPTPGAYPNSCSLSRWCHPTISSSVICFLIWV